MACGLLSIGSQMQIPVTQIELVQRGVVDVDIDSPYVYGVETASKVFTSTLGRMNTEVVGLLCLDSTHKVIGTRYLRVHRGHGLGSTGSRHPSRRS